MQLVVRIVLNGKKWIKTMRKKNLVKLYNCSYYELMGELMGFKNNFTSVLFWPFEPYGEESS